MNKMASDYLVAPATRSKAIKILEKAKKLLNHPDLKTKQERVYTLMNLAR
jgi:hypothetical protein